MDKAQFTEEIQGLTRVAFALSYTLLGSCADCEEAVSCAILSAYENLAKLRDRRRFRAWYLKILKNECYRILRNRKRFLPLDPETEAVGELPVANIDLERALRRLPKTQRIALLLQTVEGYRIPEIAEILDVPEGTVKSRLSRARAALRQALSEEENAYDFK